jgi:hypothetical protein
MKKFGITVFAAFYAFLIIGLTAERSNVWAARQADALAHRCDSQHAPCLSQTEQSDTYLSQKKRVESEFAIEVPREAVLVPICAGRYAPAQAFEYIAGQSCQRFLLRSPPTLV